MVSLSDTRDDARVRRQVRFLASEYRVIVAAVGTPLRLDGCEFVELPQVLLGSFGRVTWGMRRLGLRLAGMYERAYWRDPRMRRWLELLRRAAPVQVIVVNDLWALPLARAVDKDVPIVFDAHEHWTSESASWTRWQRVSMRGGHEWIVDRYVPLTAGVMTVSSGIAGDYEERTGRRPELVTNAPFFQRLAPTEVTRPIRLLHFGFADPRRRLEDTIDAVRSLGDRFVLDLVLARDNEYRQWLEHLVADDRRCRVLPAVPNVELLSFANRYDVGVFLLPARFPNQVHVLPNKLFDYIQARLAVAIGPSPEMAAIVREWDCGVVSDSFEAASFATALDRLTVPEVERMKRNADRAARVLTAESNRDTILKLVRQAIGA